MHYMDKLVVSWYHCNCISLYIRIVEVSESRIHSVIKIAHKDADIARMVTLETIDGSLDMLKSKLSDDLRGHLVARCHIILTMS